MRIESRGVKAALPTAKAMSTLELLDNPGPVYRAELVWRIGLPLSALLLALLAIPLSFVNPRAGRSLNLILAILVYMIYNNVLSIAQAWVVQQKIGLAAGMLGVHLMMLVILMALFVRRLTLFSLDRFIGFR